MVIRHLAFLALAASASLASAQSQPAAQSPAPRTSTPRVIAVDRVVAVVNDEAVTQYDVNDAKQVVLQQLKQQKVQPPSSDVLEKQVLERLITERSLMQVAKENGVKVDDTQIERAIARIAQDNKMTPEELRKELEKQGVTYTKYRDDVRNEIIMQRLREREVDNKITVSDAEVDQYLATMKAQNAGGEAEFRLAHILVLVPEQATSDQIDAKRRRAEEALKALKGGVEFGQVAAGFSDASDAMTGGSLGWRSGARLPTVFADAVRTMKPGDTSTVLRSAAGFHIVKLLEKRSHNEATVVDQTHVRHILIRVNETTSESDGKGKIERLKDRLDNGSKFEDVAKLNSEDASSAKGGDLGWVSPGDTVPEFQEPMNKLAINEISAPVRSPFGWHLIQVLERRKQDVSASRERTEAQLAIRQRKSEEAFQDWVRQVRDRAYVEMRLDDR
jgi:peptidyl-prolyl cis-trans isomerase SurA